jgi:flagellar assembly protein FliH
MSSETFLAIPIPRLAMGGATRAEEQARARGHAAGYTDGLRAAQAEMDRRMSELDEAHARATRAANDRSAQAVAVIQAAAKALDDRSVPVLAEAHAALAAAAVDLAEAVLGYELGNEENSARRALERALGYVQGGEEIRTVRLHPADLALLDDDTRTRAGVEFTGDDSLARGDAVAEFPDGYLDARLSAALARAAAALILENP